MMRRVLRILRGALAFAIVAVPALVADPFVQHAVARHPAVAGYLAVAVGVLHDLAAARQDRKTAAEVASSGSPTMGAK